MNLPLPRQIATQLQASLERAAHIQVTPLSAHTGAQIDGVDLRQPLTPEEVATLRLALLRWKVIFFRDQHLSHEQHVAFARQFDPQVFHTDAELAKDTFFQGLAGSGWHTAAISMKPMAWFQVRLSFSQNTEKPAKTSSVMTSWIVLSCAAE